MPATKPFPDPADAHALMDEADIGSGEKTAGQIETEAMIRAIPPLPPQDERDDGEQPGDAARERREHDASLERDEPSGDLDNLDPVPPKGS